MALRRFWVERISDPLIIAGDLFHHIREVVRFGAGDRFELLPGDGSAHLVEIQSVGKRELLAKLIEKRSLEPLKKPLIHLAVSVPKYAKVDWIIEKSVELGVHAVTLFVSDFSFARKLSDLTTNRWERWVRINRAATQQSGRGTLMRLEPPATLRDLLTQFKSRSGAVGLFPFEGDASMSWTQAIRDAKNASPEVVFIFVGSEGGFSKGEVELFQQFELMPMTMGAQILRVETACVALVSVIKYEFEV